MRPDREDNRGQTRPGTRTGRPRWRSPLAVLAAALAIAAAVLPGIASAGDEPSATPAPDPQLTPAPYPQAQLPDLAGPEADRGIHLSSLPQHRVPGPSRKGGTYTARILIRTTVRRSPGGKSFWVARAFSKWSGGAQQLMVLGSKVHDGVQWLKVRLPGRPNGSSGWLPRDRVKLEHSPNYLVIDLSRRMVLVYGKNGRRTARIPVVIGKPGTPTPRGLFAIYDRVLQSDRHGFVGPWVVPLTAHSNKLRRFDGGPGLVALHGRDGASFLDPLRSASSHGCVRMNNSWIRKMVKLRLGTAVRIRR